MDEELKHLHLLGATGASRVVMEGDREWLVIPTVALMEGVIHPVNARTAEFVSASVLEKAAASWNGKPVTLGHPVKNGTQCSANSEDIKATHHIGEVRNARFVDKKLLCDSWIDIACTEKLHPKLLASLRANAPQEVSVGAFVYTDDKAGDFHGKPYKAAWLETKGDHLAMLYGGRGACSQAMGCGTHRAAMHLVTAESIELDESPLIEACEAYLAVAKAKMAECETCGGTGQVKDGEHQKDCPACEGEGKMRAAAGARNSAADAQIIQSVHDQAMALGATCDRANYKMMEEGEEFRASEFNEADHPRDADGRFTGDGAMSVKAGDVQSGDIVGHKYAGNPGQVKIGVVRYNHPAKAKGRRIFELESGDQSVGYHKDEVVHIKRTKLKSAEAAAITPEKAAERGQGESTMDKTKKAELIAALVTCACSGFKDGDQAFLETATDVRLEEFKAAADGRKAANEAAAKNETDLRNATAKITVIKGKLKAAEAAPTAEQWMAQAPAEIRTLIENQKAQEGELREGLIKELKAANANTEDELKAMPTAQLQTLAKYAKVQAPDFSGRGMPQPRAAAANDLASYAPPDPYAAELKTLRERTVN